MPYRDSCTELPELGRASFGALKEGQIYGSATDGHNIHEATYSSLALLAGPMLHNPAEEILSLS